MSHRPFPGAERARHQLRRHGHKAAPAVGLTFAQAAARLAAWGEAGRGFSELVEARQRARRLPLAERCRRAASALLDQIVI